jgi:uncharacterized protein YbaP (TraB family)
MNTRTTVSRWIRTSLYLLGAFAAPILFTPVAKAEPAMWVIRTSDSTIYLIGTMHLLKHGAEWNSTKVRKAVTDSTELWLEVADIDNQASIAPIVTQYGLDMEHPLSSKLTATQKQKLDTVAATYGFPTAMLEPMRPWIAAVTFTMLPLQKAGYDPDAGIDRALRAQAATEGDKILGFETAEEQIRFLADLPEADQIAFLDETLTDAEKGMDQLEKMAKAWMDGDSDTLSNIMVNEVKKASPALYQKLLVQRNVAWSNQIVKMLKTPGVRQIAVGAAHLVGPDSVQVQLAKRGIKVDRY